MTFLLPIEILLACQVTDGNIFIHRHEYSQTKSPSWWFIPKIFLHKLDPLDSEIWNHHVTFIYTPYTRLYAIDD